MRARVIEALTDGMTSLGWQASDRHQSVITPVPARFYRLVPGGDERFVATAQFGFRGSVSGRPSLSKKLRVEGYLGVTAPAVERLLVAVGARHRNAAAEEELAHC